MLWTVHGGRRSTRIRPGVILKLEMNSFQILLDYLKVSMLF